MTDAPVKKKPGRPKGSVAKSITNIARNRPKSARARLDAYLKTLPKVTLNDITLLENMVSMELEMERLRNKMPDEKDGLEARKLSEAISNYSKEYRLIQDSLGIGRSQRSTEIDMQSEVDKLVEESTVLVEKSGVPISCHFCKSDYEMGWVLFHFRDDVAWSWTFACPACKQVNHVTGDIEFTEIRSRENRNGNQPVIEGRIADTSDSTRTDAAPGDRDPVG